MASLNVQFNRLTANIKDIYNGKIEAINKAFVETGEEMLIEFRQEQYLSPHIPTPTRSKQDTNENKQKALAFAQSHIGGSPKTSKGIPWINRSFRAARGVIAYVDRNDSNTIAVVLYHSMSYGAYLEFAYNRKFAVIEPLIRNAAPRLMQKLRKIMGGK